MNFKNILSIIVSLCCLFPACKNANIDAEYMEESRKMESANTSASLQYETEENSTSDSGQKGSNQSISKASKKIIKTGRITLEIADYQKARVAIDILTSKYDATIINEREDRSSYRRSNSLTIRLAPENFKKFVVDLSPLALNVESKNIQSRDVSKEFIDLKIRLDNKKAVVSRYRELLNKANSVKDILAVEEELRKVTEEIESTEGQLKYLRDQVNYSTIYLNYYERIEQSPRHKKGFFARLGKSMENGWQGLQELVIALVGAWHIILFLTFLIWGIIRFWRRQKKSA